MIKVNEISVNLQNKQILDNISFAIEEGRIMMILGENGSGKTTLIKTLLARLLPQKGSVCVEDKDMHLMNEKQRAAILSYVPQIKEIVEDLKVEECIVSGVSRNLSIFSTPSKKDYEKVDTIMQLFQLTSLKGKRLHEISGGELQMTYLARAFIQNANVILMDEPCTYLDYQKQHLFLMETKKLKAQDKSVFISIHDPNLALQYADEIILLHQGKIYAHLHREEGNMRKRLVQLYNEIYGQHFTLNAKDEYLAWKEE